MQSEKGKVFLKSMVKTMVYSLKKIPAMNIVADLHDEWQSAVVKVRKEQETVPQEERIARLEAAAGISSSQARTIADEVIVEIRQQGQLISREEATVVVDLASVVPSLIRERTQATLRQARHRGTALHTALPVGDGTDTVPRDAFYQSLFPRRRPRFQVGEAIPHRMPAWYFVQLLGIGGFGEVWEVRHPHLPDHFAVKFCQDALSAKVLQREAQALIALCHKLPQHPNIARLLELQLEQEPYWLAFELVTGGTLEALLRAGALSWAESLQVFRPLVVAMAAVHEVGIVHRDLKPANILLTEGNVPKIADFGIGKVLADRTAEQQKTQTRFTSMGYGSAGYMSEEQAEGKPAHPADDTFALGVLLWQMLSGSLKAPTRYLRYALEKLDSPSTVKALIMDCVDKPRNERPQNAGALLKMLDSLARNRQEKPQELSTLPTPVLSPPSIIAGTTFRDKLKDGSEGPEMVWIPAGKFVMGSNEYDREKPIHEVTIAYEFAIGKYQVTFDEYDQFCKATGKKKLNDNGWGRGQRPVINVSWQRAKNYCQWLSEQTGKFYRLPTEAEWEYACRAGTTTRFSFGDSDHELQHHGWFRSNSDEMAHPVGEKKPNPWGLYDMHGNVWEWCEDVWHENYRDAPTDGSAWLVGGEQSLRVLRGGSWSNRPGWERSVARSEGDPITRSYDDLGFRVVEFSRLAENRQEKPQAPSTAPKPPPVLSPPSIVAGTTFRDKLKDGSEGPEMVWIPAGKFMMGSNEYDSEKPIHEVTIAYEFAIGKYPVTVGQFRKFVQATNYQTDAEKSDGAYIWTGEEWDMRSDASWKNPYFSQTDNHPVVCVSWNDAKSYYQWLSEQTGQSYRLPTEIEWECVCRAGTTTRFSFGDNADDLQHYAWFTSDAGKKTHPIGEKKPNPWGLYDMHGHVWEWCEDVWHENYQGAPTDGSAWLASGEQSQRVLRGGSWNSRPDRVRSADRYGDDLTSCDSGLGFRVIGFLRLARNRQENLQEPLVYQQDSPKLPPPSIVAGTTRCDKLTKWENTILWVDDNPDNNVRERHAFESLGFSFTLASSTTQALELLKNNTYAAIISDMGRKEGAREGYVLLDALREQDEITPFFIYASSNSPEHKQESEKHGAQGNTNNLQELIRLVMLYLT